MSKMPYFDREYMSYVYEQHLFQPPFSFFEDRIDNSELRSIFLLWLAELSILPCVRLNHLTHLLLWERDTLNAFPNLSPSNFILKANLAWKEILLSPVQQANPAIYYQTLRYIDLQYPSLTLHDLAHSLGLNSSYLSRAISAGFNCTFLDLLHCRRILAFICTFHIKHESPAIDEISNILGYSSMHYFYCVFKGYTGLTPARVKAFINTYPLEQQYKG